MWTSAEVIMIKALLFIAGLFVFFCLWQAFAVDEQSKRVVVLVAGVVIGLLVAYLLKPD